jgi:hypothetical protein
MSISKSQLDALNRGLLDNIGVNANDPDLKAGNLLEEILQNVAQTLTDALRKEITEKGVTASKSLRSSVNPSNAVTVADGVQVHIVMADYWEYVESGRGPTKKGNNGGKFLWQHIEEWISAKGISVRKSNQQSTQSVLEARRSMAYAIAQKIHKRGTIKRFGYKGANFIKDVLTPQNIEAIAQHLSDMAGRKIELYVSTEQK